MPTPPQTPTYETQTFDEVSDALAEVRRQHLAGEPIVWRGPDVLHHSLGSTPPSWYFSPEGMEYMAERGRDFWDVYTQVAFQVGYHNGVVRTREDLAPLLRH